MTDEPANEGAESTQNGLTIERFLGEPTRNPEDWHWLWAGDHPFPVRSGRKGWLGRLVKAAKRLLRPAVKIPVSDLWERQRVFNLIQIEWMGTLQQQLSALHQHIDRSHHDHQGAIEAHAQRLVDLDHRLCGGMSDVMRHNDALFALVDQKLDRYRREAKDLWHRLGALIAVGEPDSPRAAEVQREQGYLDLELRYRGSEEEIAERVKTYLPYLKGRHAVLDLGCGRGEALAVFTAHGIAARGVDSSTEMVSLCRDKGLQVERAELFSYLKDVAEGSYDAVVSFHVIEHLPAEEIDRLARLAWRALAPGGVLILETPSPLSVVMAARNFWIDPTHRRPIHPAGLEVTLREAGFEPVERLDLHPFPAADRLPEIDLETVGDDQKALADQINRLRDLLDDLLFGFRDYALIGFKP